MEPTVSVEEAACAARNDALTSIWGALLSLYFLRVGESVGKVPVEVVDEMLDVVMVGVADYLSHIEELEVGAQASQGDEVIPGKVREEIERAEEKCGTSAEASGTERPKGPVTNVHFDLGYENGLLRVMGGREASWGVSVEFWQSGRKMFEASYEPESPTFVDFLYRLIDLLNLDGGWRMANRVSARVGS